jgi:hypothetical protein
MILLSAHKDTVMNHYPFEYKEGFFVGLLDNAIGVLVCNSLLLEEPNLCVLEKVGKIGLFFGNSEEWGTITPLPKLKKEDIVVVVDVASGPQYKGYDFSLENISGIDTKRINELRESLEWEGFKMKTKRWDGDPDDEDEAWAWKDKGQKVISFIIPIENGSKDTGWHVGDCSITVEKVIKAKQGLKRLINYLL